MKSIATLLIAASLLFASPAKAQDADGCAPIEQALASFEQNGLQHIVLRDEAMAAFTGLRTVAAPAASWKVEFVVVAFIPEKNAALVGFGRGTEICEGMLIPLPLAKSLMRSA